METIENGFGGWVHDGVAVSRLTDYRELLGTEKIRWWYSYGQEKGSCFI